MKNKRRKTNKGFKIFIKAIGKNRSVLWNRKISKIEEVKLPRFFVW